MAPGYKAYVYEAFGDAISNIKLRTDVQPTTLATSCVRIKVASAAINPIDWKLIEFGKFILPVSPTPENPFRIGLDVSGEVVEVGPEVHSLKVGDLVYAMADFASAGTAAEYVDLDEQFVAPKPQKLSFDEAAAVPLASLCSYQSLLTFGKLQAGQRVLIIGASGGTGNFAVQIAKAVGAHVIATSSFRNAHFVQSLGADEVIDYTATKWSDVIEPHSLDLIYDCGFEPNAWNHEAQKCLKKETGQFVTIGQPTGSMMTTPIGATLHEVRTHSSAEDLRQISKLIEDGKLTISIDSVYPFEKYVEAVGHLKTGRTRGKIVIQVHAEYALSYVGAFPSEEDLTNRCFP